MKKILLSLFVCLIGLINFGYCDFSCGPVFVSANNYTDGYDWSTTVARTEFSDTDLFCFTNSSVANGINLKLDCAGNGITLNALDSYCFYKSSGISTVCAHFNGAGKIGWSYYDSSCIDHTYDETQCISKYNLMPISDYTSANCMVDFNLLPVSSVDQDYCVNNGFCPSGGGDCPVCPGSGDNWSALYINDIQHLGKPIINITFPDYLDWDYTTTENEFNLDIVGYPVDTEYIDGIIRTQNYKPTSEDFTQLVGMLAPYSKYLLFLLFIFIIWAWIKKPFKSKKL